MELLGDIFFLGKFQEGCVPFRWMTDQDRTTAHGFTKPGSDYRPEEIVIQPYDLSKARVARDYRSALTSVLLHEQCHAFCALVSYEAGYRFGKGQDPHGETGHTASWFFPGDARRDHGASALPRPRDPTAGLLKLAAGGERTREGWVHVRSDESIDPNAQGVACLCRTVRCGHSERSLRGPLTGCKGHCPKGVSCSFVDPVRWSVRSSVALQRRPAFLVR